MKIRVEVNENSRRAVELLIKFQQISRAAVAEKTEINRPNLVGWLNGRNGISEKKLAAVMRTLHIPDAQLESPWVHRWAVFNWEEVRELIDLLVVPEAKKKIEIFHLARESEKPVAILRCAATVNSGIDFHLDYEVFFLIILTPAPLAPPLGPLSDIHLGCGVVRAEQPDLRLEVLPSIDPFQLQAALSNAYDEDDPAEDVSGIFDHLRARHLDEALESELYAAVKEAGRENTRFMLGLSARQPDTVRALQAARKFGYSEEQVCGWIALLTGKPEFSRVLVEALLSDLK